MIRFPATYAHRNFAFNEHLNADGTLISEAEALDTVTLDRRDVNPRFRDLVSPLHLGQGATAGRVHKGPALLRLGGRIVVAPAAGNSMLARLDDRERALRAALDPYLASLASPSTEGVHAFDFTEATLDTANFPTGRMSLRYYGRPVDHPSITDEVVDANERPFQFGLWVPDPRAYEQAERTLSLSAGTPTGQTVHLGNTPTAIKLTITMSGAGSSSFLAGDDFGGGFIGLNLSGAINGDVIVVVMETCGPYGEGRKITKNGSRAFSLKNNGDPSWSKIMPGTHNYTLTNPTNVSSCVVAWRSAWVG